MENQLLDYLQRVRRFEAEAHEILGAHEEAPSRVFILDKTYQDLDDLSLDQDELFRQALRCVEQQVYRAAHVMAWAGFMDFLQEKLAEDGLKKLGQQYPKWDTASLDRLREEVPEYQLIQAARKLGLCRKSQMKALHGLLNRRNECAHPSDYYPGYNEALGYISEILQRVEALRGKSIT